MVTAAAAASSSLAELVSRHLCSVLAALTGGVSIEVERENNGFEARWCGNRVTQGGSRPHVIFARNEVRITVFDDGLEGKNLPTGFNADVEGMLILKVLIFYQHFQP